jgi:hypothetical protein
MKMVKQKHGGALKIPSKGETHNPNGRPRKFVLTAKHEGYKLSEVSDTLTMMLAMNLEELRKVYENPKSTLLEKIVAKALKNAVGKGTFGVVEQILERLYGKTTNLNIGDGAGKVDEAFPNDDAINANKAYLQAVNKK